MTASVQAPSKFWTNTTFSEILIVLAFIYSLQFVFFPLNTSRIVILYVIVTGILLRKDKVFFSYHKPTFRALSPMFIFLAYLSVSTLVGSARNISILANYLLIVFQIGLGAYLMAMFFFKDNFSFHRLLFIFLLIFSIQGFFILLSFLIPPYREFMYEILPLVGNIKEGTEIAMIRVRGLTQGIGASYSAQMSFGFFIAAYFFAVLNLSKRDRLIIFAGLFFILIGILFAGRTGLVMIPYAVAFYCLLLFTNGKFTLKTILLILSLPVAGVIAYFFIKWVYLLVTGGGIILPGGEDLLSEWEDWAFGNFIDFFSGKTSNLKTLEILKTHLFIPKDDLTLLLGDIDTWGNVRSDIGYVRLLFASGVIGAVLNYLSIICIYVQMMLLSADKNMKLFFIFYLIWLFIIEYKEPFSVHFLFTTITMLMLFVRMRFTDGGRDTTQAENA